MQPFDYAFGIEEEYFLSSAATGNLVSHAPKRLLNAAKERLGESVTAELLQSQIEIASPIFHSIDEALHSMASMRSTLAELVATMGLRLVAASTHPLGAWREQSVTEKPRYDELMSDFRIIGQRNLVCGMHVHVAVPEGVDRVALMNRAMRWLPMFLALSTSSPFWDRHITGLLSYRQAIYDEWPRSGIPDFFNSEDDYRDFVDVMAKGGAVKDASYLWWAIRPALKYPTLELRIADVCTRVEDGVALAALFRALLATLVSHPELGAERSTHTRRLIDENRWHAKRDGTGAKFIDEQQQTAVPLAELLPQLFDIIGPEADRLGCKPSLTRIEDIMANGSSAHAQLRIYNERRVAGDSRNKALHHVVDWLIDTTARPVGR
ncbi:MAG TPA: carboxylate-amine ligase [Steroidobacteraceae bacterium]|nr:carboxylate-amine ligase [Steroidobacteraceae bacterium]